MKIKRNLKRQHLRGYGKAIYSEEQFDQVVQGMTVIQRKSAADVLLEEEGWTPAQVESFLQSMTARATQYVKDMNNVLAAVPAGRVKKALNTKEARRKFREIIPQTGPVEEGEEPADADEVWGVGDLPLALPKEEWVRLAVRVAEDDPNTPNLRRRYIKFHDLVKFSEPTP